MIGKINKTSLPEKGAFYGNLNVEDITYSDYNHLKNFLIDFEIKYYGFYLKGDILLLADAFEKFRKIILSICLLDPETSLSSRISLKSSFKIKTM